MISSDIKLDGEYVILDGKYTKLKTSCLMLDYQSRRVNNDNTGYRRALLHNDKDGLTINYGGDYPGGIELHGKIHGTTHMEKLEVEYIHVNEIHIGPYQMKIDKDKNILTIRDDLTGNTGTIEMGDIDLQKNPHVSPKKRFTPEGDQHLQELKNMNGELKKQLEELTLRVQMLERH